MSPELVINWLHFLTGDVSSAENFTSVYERTAIYNDTECSKVRVTRQLCG